MRLPKHIAPNLVSMMFILDIILGFYRFAFIKLCLDHCYFPTACKIDPFKFPLPSCSIIAYSGTFALKEKEKS